MEGERWNVEGGTAVREQFSHKAAPLINAQFIMHNFVAKAALKILEAAFIMPVLIVRVLTACD